MKFNRFQFHPSKAVEEFIEEVYPRIGARNKTVLERAGLFLALGRGLPPEFKPNEHKKEKIKNSDQNVIGSKGLVDMVSAALNYRMGKTLEESEYREAFRRYFEYG